MFTYVEQISISSDILGSLRTMMDSIFKVRLNFKLRYFSILSEEACKIAWPRYTLEKPTTNTLSMPMAGIEYIDSECAGR